MYDIRTVCAGVLCGFAAIVGSTLQARDLDGRFDHRPPNVVLFPADDLGVECVGAYGGEAYQTPNLDRLAADGMQFNHYYAFNLPHWDFDATPDSEDITSRKNDANFPDMVAYTDKLVGRVVSQLDEFGKPDLQPYRFIWARGRRYKLYSDGRFYDLENDLAETSRIPPGRGTLEAEAARKKLQAVLRQYERQRKTT